MPIALPSQSALPLNPSPAPLVISCREEPRLLIVEFLPSLLLSRALSASDGLGRWAVQCTSTLPQRTGNELPAPCVFHPQGLDVALMMTLIGTQALRDAAVVIVCQERERPGA